MVMKCLSMVESLLRNSTKYGALNDPEGVLEVHISRGSEELRIKWTERAAGAAGYSDAVDSDLVRSFWILQSTNNCNETMPAHGQKTAWTSRSLCLANCLAKSGHIRRSCQRLSKRNTPDGSDLSERLCMIWPR
jgi:hypothetical protein